MKPKIFLIFIVAVLIAFPFGYDVFSQEAAVGSAAKEPAFARSFLGAYKKTARFEKELKKYCKKYKVDYLLVLAIAMYESGGNDDLVSSAGARGLMQVMPSTKEYMKTDSYIEAGVKYIAHLQDMFKKILLEADGCVIQSKLKSYIIKAYNGGPGRVKNGLIKLETFQYLQGVSIYYNLLSQNFDEMVEFADGELAILTLSKRSSWEDISAETGVSVLELKMYNAFLSNFHCAEVPKGKAIAYPVKTDGVKLRVKEESGAKRYFYQAKPADILQHVANAFGITYYDMRNANGMLLWGFIQFGSELEVTGSPHTAGPAKE